MQWCSLVVCLCVCVVCVAVARAELSPVLCAVIRSLIIGPSMRKITLPWTSRVPRATWTREIFSSCKSVSQLHSRPRKLNECYGTALFRLCTAWGSPPPSHPLLYDSVQNRYQFQRYEHQRFLNGEGFGKEGRHEKYLWHGCKETDPELLCGGTDGVDFRMVLRCRIIPLPRALC